MAQAALTPTIVNEFIQKIVIHMPDRSDGKRRQKIWIYYNVIELFDVPEESKMVAIA